MGDKKPQYKTHLNWPPGSYMPRQYPGPMIEIENNTVDIYLSDDSVHRDGFAVYVDMPMNKHVKAKLSLTPTEAIDLARQLCACASEVIDKKPMS